MDKWLDVHVTFDPGWTTEAPTEPGWYWVMVGGIYQPDPPLTMARVSIADEKVYINYPVNGYEFENDFEVSEVTHWLGPISQPEPPTNEKENL